MNRNTWGAVLKAAFSAATVSREDQFARKQIEELEGIASTKLEQGRDNFEKVMRRIVGEMDQ